MVRNDFSKTVGGKLFAKWQRQVQANYGIPNYLLPKVFQDDCRGGRTIKRLNEMCDKKEGLTSSPHKELKAIKEQNIRDYANQIADNERKGIEAPIEPFHMMNNSNNQSAFINALSKE